jgi:hypothetical protein
MINALAERVATEVEVRDNFSTSMDDLTKGEVAIFGELAGLPAFPWEGEEKTMK